MSKKSKKQIISEMMEDLEKIIGYDEWSAREYGEEKVDLYTTAINLYEADYRKVNKNKDN